MVARTRSAANLCNTSPTKRLGGQRGSKAPTKRRLFDESVSQNSSMDTEGSCGACASQQMQLADCELERLDSASSTLTIASDDACAAAAGPSTPDRERHGRQHPRRPASPVAVAAAAGLDTALEAPLLCVLQNWRQQLVSLQPLVQLGDEILLGAVEVTKELAAARHDLCHAMHTSPAYLYAYLAAALWTVSKLSGVRTQIPNRSLLSQATRVHPQALSDFELDLLVSLEWDVAAVLRRQGLLCV